MAVTLDTCSVGGLGALMLNELEVTGVSPVPVNMIVAPVTGPRLKADNPLNVADPAPLADVDPPGVQAPAPTVAFTVAVVVVVLP